MWVALALTGCEAPKLQGLDPGALTSVLGMVAVVTPEVATEVHQAPRSRAYFERVAAAIDGVSAGTNYQTAYLRARVRAIPAPDAAARRAALDGVRFYLGNPFLNRENYQFLLGGLAQAIRSGLDRTPEQAKRDFKRERWLYVAGMLNRPSSPNLDVAEPTVVLAGGPASPAPPRLDTASALRSGQHGSPARVSY